MKTLTTLRKLMQFTGTAGAVTALELADAASGGHIADFLRAEQEKFDDALDADTRDAALQALDLARLNHVRIRLVLDLLGKLVDDQDRIAHAWAGRPEPAPELEQVVAITSLVATGYTSQPSLVRKELLLDAMFGAFDPDLFLWGQQDVLLQDLMDARLGRDDIEVLRALAQFGRPRGACTPMDAEMESWERLASRDFVEMMHLDTAPGNPGPRFFRHRTELHGNNNAFQVRPTVKGTRLLQLLDAGAQLRSNRR